MNHPDLSSVRRLAEVEKEAILHAMQLSMGRTKLAARALGIGRMTLWRRLRAYGFTARAVFDAWQAEGPESRSSRAGRRAKRQEPTQRELAACALLERRWEAFRAEEPWL